MNGWDVTERASVSAVPSAYLNPSPSSWRSLLYRALPGNMGKGKVWDLYT
jgi:hypothetical protein